MTRERNERPLHPRACPSASRTIGWVLAVALLGIHGAVRAEAPGPLAERLDQAIGRVAAARDRAAPLGDPDALFPETEEAAGPGGVLQVDHASLRAEWTGVPAEDDARHEALERLRHRLVAVRAEVTPAAGSASAGAPPPDGWREKLTQVLSRPEFSKRRPEEDWRVRLMQWLQERLGFHLPQGTPQRVGRILSWIIYVLAGAALAAALYFLVRAALPLVVRDRRTGRATPPPAPERVETPEGLLALADARTRAGNHRGAAQALFRWLLLTLHQTGRLEYDPALTNREHLTRLKVEAGIPAAFERLSRQFERIWYGFHPVAPEELAVFRADCRRVAEGRA